MPARTATTARPRASKKTASPSRNGHPQNTPEPVAPSPHGGMGAIPVEGGVSFRVWAPHAKAMRVSGSFCDWTENGPALERENEAGYWSVFVPGVQAGAAYKFVLDTDAGTLWRNDPYARQMTNSVGEALVYDDAAFDWGEKEAQWQLPAWNSLVIYEVHGGTFFGKPFASQEDDGAWTLTEQARERLDYLQRLGVTAIGLMPVAEFPGDVSWGYNPAHLFAIESAYGGPDALKTLVREAHARGLAVIVDVVYNHFGPSDLDLWQFDGWSEHDGGGIYFYNDHRSETPWGHTRPDYGRPEVRAYLVDNARMWLRDFHADGLRFDMTLYMRSRTANPFEEPLPDGWRTLQEINAMVAAEFPGRITIAEDLQCNNALTTPISEGGAGFGAQWDAAFVHPVRAVLEAPTDAERSIGTLASALTHHCGPDTFARVVYAESHDETSNGRQRLYAQALQTLGVGRGEEAQDLAASLAALGLVLTLTAPGIPMLFQGQELLADGWFDDHADAERLADATPHALPHATPRARALAGLTRDLVRLRRGEVGAGGLTGQALSVVCADEQAKVLAYLRTHE
ncbi:MAG TPA: alpha-amylase family glycosyl hydrolase, partial [Rhodothermales bacterium]|nr:alpha-amylase family glycosyl hydrolase [Rhodothermales bacterium]